MPISDGVLLAEPKWGRFVTIVCWKSDEEKDRTRRERMS